MRVEADLVRTDRHTDRQTDKPTTVTLASACARRGLIILCYCTTLLHGLHKFQIVQLECLHSCTCGSTHAQFCRFRGMYARLW